MQTMVLFQAFDIKILVKYFSNKIKRKKDYNSFFLNKKTNAYYEEMETRFF